MEVDQKPILQHKVHLKPDTYITAMNELLHAGPMKQTVDDFWRMVWEYKVQGIVALTRCVEMGKVYRPLCLNIQ